MKTPVFILLFLLLSSLSSAKDAGAEARMPADVGRTAECYSVSSLHADYFVLISDVPGVLDADKKLIPSLDRARIAELIEAGVINGGMIPKVQSCLHALDEGCSRALILDGRQPSSLRRYLLDGEPLGTVVTA